MRSLNVIDFIASDLQQLDELSNGRAITINGISQEIQLNEVALSSESKIGALACFRVAIKCQHSDAHRYRGTLLEFYNPGVGLPGVLRGFVCYSRHVFLTNAACELRGPCVNSIGNCLMVAEAFSQSSVSSGWVAMAAFTLGSIMLMDTEVRVTRVHCR